MILNNKKLLSVRELSNLLGISKATIYSWSSKKQFPYYKIGQRIFFDIEDIENSLHKFRIEPVKRKKYLQIR